MEGNNGIHTDSTGIKPIGHGADLSGVAQVGAPSGNVAGRLHHPPQRRRCGCGLGRRRTTDQVVLSSVIKRAVLILPAVQINIRAGELPPKEDNGIAYVKIPMNAL